MRRADAASTRCQRDLSHGWASLGGAGIAPSLRVALPQFSLRYAAPDPNQRLHTTQQPHIGTTSIAATQLLSKDEKSPRKSTARLFKTTLRTPSVTVPPNRSGSLPDSPHIFRWASPLPSFHFQTALNAKMTVAHRSTSSLDLSDWCHMRPIGTDGTTGLIGPSLTQTGQLLRCNPGVRPHGLSVSGVVL